MEKKKRKLEFIKKEITVLNNTKAIVGGKIWVTDIGDEVITIESRTEGHFTHQEPQRDTKTINTPGGNEEPDLLFTTQK